MQKPATVSNFTNSLSIYDVLKARKMMKKKVPPRVIPKHFRFL